ncbi:hypothetical protein [Cysteiniphilum sp. QT6929]|uniref:hypothetical protein n=1 Tax=Cysteiniphilum sp. QT6929 TaxID=2975055 RepID=UPI0024B332DF|nr:hypothetical protein [Cysteiniphilum sp. QT6929]WHN65503.1 hypothetical protein NYP54_10785 [Cysteiniphilum sp. QT6929]
MKSIEQNSDILHIICQHLQIKDITNLLLTNKAIYKAIITQDKYRPLIMKMLVLDYIASAHTNTSQALSDICEELHVSADLKDNANQMINNFFSTYRLENTQRNQWDLQEAIYRTKKLSLAMMTSNYEFLMMDNFDTRLFDGRKYSKHRDYLTKFK